MEAESILVPDLLTISGFLVGPALMLLTQQTQKQNGLFLSVPNYLQLLDPEGRLNGL